jgi:type I restriction enzyme S subunit
MPKGWKIRKIRDIAEVVGGSTPDTRDSSNYGGSIPWITVKDLSQHKRRYIFRGERNITEKGLKAIGNRLIPKGSLLISSRAPIGYIAIAGTDLTTNQGIRSLVFKPNCECDPEFVYYLIKHNIKIFENFASGTTFKEITGSTIEELEFLFPLYPEQRKIAEILGSLDDKIELNYEMNKTLEAMAKAIFKSWFVDFEPFKDELVYDKELGKEIPKGWRMGQLGEILAEIESGSRPSGGVSSITSGIPSIGAEHIIGLGRFDYSKTKYVPEKFFREMKRGRIKNGDVLLYKDGAQIGRKTYFDYDFPFEKCCINEHVFILRTNGRVTQKYLYFWLDQEWITKCLINLSLTSAQPGLNQESVKTIPMLIPEKEVVNQFDRVLEPFIALIFTNAKETRILEQIRDSLLPKLLSGEIRVKVDVEKEFPEEAKKLKEIEEEKVKLQGPLNRWLK